MDVSERATVGGRALKVNFGCGKKLQEGWFNVDAVSREDAAPDLIYRMEFDADNSLVEPIPLDDGCADEFMALHVIEHFYAFQADAVVDEWKRVLKPGGKLILELPNIELAARNLLEGFPDQLSMWGLYGDPSHSDPYMCHRWGYTPRTIKHLLKMRGFVDIKVLLPETHMKRADRDMRVEAIKA